MICWCDMCGYNASISEGMLESFDQTGQPCPDCMTVGDMCFLELAEKLPDYVIPDEHQRAWRP